MTDDLPAIVKAHAHANEQGLPVRSNPDAIYHLGRRALTAIIQTDTEWSTSRFISDDSLGVEDHKRSLFQVESRLAPVPLKIDRLSVGQEPLDHQPAPDLLVLVENSNRRLFISIGNRVKGPEGYDAWSRNIRITRSNTIVDGVTLQVVGE